MPWPPLVMVTNGVWAMWTSPLAASNEAETLYQTLRNSGFFVLYSSSLPRPRPMRSASSPASL
ncbi:MAG: hypothetical protein WCJ87_14520, partial [Burkholderiales bacterium]